MGVFVQCQLKNMGKKKTRRCQEIEDKTRSVRTVHRKFDISYIFRYDTWKLSMRFPTLLNNHDAIPLAVLRLPTAVDPFETPRDRLTKTTTPLRVVFSTVHERCVKAQTYGWVRRFMLRRCRTYDSLHCIVPRDTNSVVSSRNHAVAVAVVVTSLSSFFRAIL